jgi:hypothetical protein
VAKAVPHQRLGNEAVDDGDGGQALHILCRQGDSELLEAFLQVSGNYIARLNEPRMEEGFVLPKEGRRKMD